MIQYFLSYWKHLTFQVIHWLHATLPSCRQIGKMLNAREPKIVNGPQILDKYVGESEANVRKLFEDAEKEEKAVSLTYICVMIWMNYVFLLMPPLSHEQNIYTRI